MVNTESGGGRNLQLAVAEGGVGNEQQVVAKRGGGEMKRRPDAAQTYVQFYEEIHGNADAEKTARLGKLAYVDMMSTVGAHERDATEAKIAQSLMLKLCADKQWFEKIAFEYKGPNNIKFSRSIDPGVLVLGLVLIIGIVVVALYQPVAITSVAELLTFGVKKLGPKEVVSIIKANTRRA